MEERLKQLAREFKEATNVRIADVMHNAVRRNIALNHELNSMLKVCQELETRSAECKETDRALRLQCELLEGEAKIAQQDALNHRRAMHELAHSHVNTVLECGRVQRENMRLGNYERMMDQYRAKCAESEEKVKVLERQVREIGRAREEVLKEVREKCEEFNKLNKILNEAKQCVLEALQVPFLRASISDKESIPSRWHYYPSLGFSRRKAAWPFWLLPGFVTAVCNFYMKEL